jgi:hypothetical protein
MQLSVLIKWIGPGLEGSVRRAQKIGSLENGLGDVRNSILVDTKGLKEIQGLNFQERLFEQNLV